MAESEMVERVAVYIRVASPRAGRTKSDGDLMSVPLSEAVCRDLARAAIEGMRVPTEAMCSAYDEADEALVENRYLYGDEAWAAMIDAALATPPVKKEG